MDNPKEFHCIMADLEKVEKILKNLEARPECHGCVTMVRRGRRITRRVIKNMTQKKRFKVNWVLLEQVIQILSRLLSLINLEQLKWFFNNCKKCIEIIYECCCKTWQTIKDDSYCSRCQTERSC
jgi:hypothetical protein